MNSDIGRFTLHKTRAIILCTLSLESTSIRPKRYQTDIPYLGTGTSINLAGKDVLQPRAACFLQKRIYLNVRYWTRIKHPSLTFSKTRALGSTVVSLYLLAASTPIVQQRCCCLLTVREATWVLVF